MEFCKIVEILNKKGNVEFLEMLPVEIRKKVLRKFSCKCIKATDKKFSNKLAHLIREYNYSSNDLAEVVYSAYLDFRMKVIALNEENEMWNKMLKGE